jgi:predicted small integral membrane protein
MAWRGKDQDNLWVSTSTDGLNWSAQKELSDRSTRNGPAVTGTVKGPHGGRLYTMAWRGLGQDNIWVATSTDGLKWSAQKELSDRSTRSSPGITHSDKLNVFYMAWQGLNQNNIWVSHSEDGLQWSPQVELKDRATQGGPIGLTPNETLYMAWQGLNQNNIWVSTLLP